MTEQEPPAEPISLEKAKRQRQTRGTARWNVKAIAQRLHSKPLVVADPVYGDGSRLLLGLAEPVTGVELYAKSSAARIRCQGLTIEMTGVATPLVTEEELSAEEESVVLVNPSTGNDLRLGISAQGDVSLFIAPHQALEVQSSPPAQESLQTPPIAGVNAPEQAMEKEAQERINIAGRVGAVPAFRTTPKGVLIARFPLAERQAETTTWHRVIAFNERAEKLKGSLTKGQLVEVVGYVHEREVHGRDGSTKSVKEIYAAVIKPAPNS